MRSNKKTMTENNERTGILSVLATLPSTFVLIYLGLFGVICLDELMFETFYLSRYIPLSESGREFLRMVYWPLLNLTGIK